MFQKNRTKYTYNGANQLKEEERFEEYEGTPELTTQYSYDGRGNMTDKEITYGTGNDWEYVYDEENRQTQVKEYTTSWETRGTYTYDALGRRIRRDAPNEGEDFKYFYDGVDCIAEYDADDSDVLEREYLTPGLDENVCMFYDSDTYYYVHDGLGSVRNLVMTSGETTYVENYYTYYAFGEDYLSDADVDNTFTYTSRRWDNESQTHYYRARMYNAANGRFNGRDTIKNVNLYSYVSNRPILMIDPFGLDQSGTTDIKMTNLMAEYDKGNLGNKTDIMGRTTWGVRLICDENKKMDTSYAEGYDQIFKTTDSGKTVRPGGNKVNIFVNDSVMTKEKYIMIMLTGTDADSDTAVRERVTRNLAMAALTGFIIGKGPQGAAAGVIGTGLAEIYDLANASSMIHVEYRINLACVCENIGGKKVWVPKIQSIDVGGWRTHGSLMSGTVIEENVHGKKQTNWWHALGIELNMSDAKAGRQILEGDVQSNLGGHPGVQADIEKKLPAGVSRYNLTRYGVTGWNAHWYKPVSLKDYLTTPNIARDYWRPSENPPPFTNEEGTLK